MWAGLGFAEALTHDDMALLAASVGSQGGRVSFKDWTEKILPLTRSRMETPATPTASQQPGGALGEEASCSSFGTATPAASAAPSVQQQQQQQEGGAAGRTRPNSATSCFTQPAASVDVADVRQLVVTGGCNTFCR